MNITMRDGRKFSGTPLRIVQSMRAVAFDQKDATIDRYIDFVIDNVQRSDEVALVVAGTTEEERAASLLAELKRVGFAT